MTRSERTFGRWASCVVLLSLGGVEADLIHWMCEYRGFMTVREFCAAAVIPAAFHTLIAFPMRRLLPVGLWQVPLITVAPLMLGWHCPDPARFRYFTAVANLRVGMTVSQVREVASPHPVFRPYPKEWPPRPSGVPLPVDTENFTGALACRAVKSTHRDSFNDGAEITFAQGRVTDISVYEGD